MAVTIPIPYPVSGVTTIYLVLRRRADGWFLSNLDGTFAEAPAAYPYLIESTILRQVYEAAALPLDDGLYDLAAYRRLGATQNKQIDELLPRGMLLVKDGVDADEIVKAKEATLTTIASYIDTEITEIINAIAALQADVGNPSVDATTIYARLQALATAVAGFLPQTAHTYTAGEKIVVPQGDVMNLPFSLGSAHDCSGGKRVFFYAWDNATGALFITKLECTLTDALNVIGTVPLTATHLNTLRSCTYEYVRFDADGTSNKHTIVQGPMVIDDSLAI